MKKINILLSCLAVLFLISDTLICKSEDTMNGFTFTPYVNEKINIFNENSDKISQKIDVSIFEIAYTAKSKDGYEISFVFNNVNQKSVNIKRLVLGLEFGKSMYIEDIFMNTDFEFVAGVFGGFSFEKENVDTSTPFDLGFYFKGNVYIPVGSLKFSVGFVTKIPFKNTFYPEYQGDSKIERLNLLRTSLSLGVWF